MQITLGNPAPTPEINEAAGAMRVAYELAAKRHPFVDVRLRVTRDCALERIRNMQPAGAVAHLREVTDFFSRYAEMRDREIENLGFRSDGFITDPRPIWKMPPAVPVQPGEATRSYLASLGRKGVTLSVGRDGTLIINPFWRTTEHDRAEIAKRTADIVFELHSSERVA